jgi:hypothetical protein
MWSVLVAVVGVGLTGVLARRLERRSPPSPASGGLHVFWLLGLGAGAAPWLVEFVLLLGRSPETLPGLKRLVLAGIAAGLLGVVVTDTALRRRAASATPGGSQAAWRLGLAALAPGWLILLVARLWLGR